MALTVEKLFAAVYADPASDEPRQVLADRLLELGDPRGEVIALQMKDPKNARAKKLIKQHRAAWLGPLAGWNDIYETWRRGFPADVSGEPTREMVGDVRWNTVEAVDFYGDGGVQAVLGAPCLRALRIARHVLPAGVKALVRQRQRPPLEELKVIGSPPDVAKLVAFPKLTRLMLYLPRWPAEPSHIAWLWKSALVRQLIDLELRVNDNVECATQFIATCEPFAALKKLTISHAYLALHLERDADGRFSRLHMHNNGTVNATSYLPSFARPLQAFAPDALTWFRYSKSGGQHPAAKLAPFRRALEKQTRLKEQRWR
jgi:uncharacterized protein (TIGR02996 family)